MFEVGDISYLFGVMFVFGVVCSYVKMFGVDLELFV